MAGGGGGFYPLIDNHRSSSCELIKFKTCLVDTDDKVLETVSVGDVLNVETYDDNVWVYSDEHKKLGRISNDVTQSLISCISANYIYLAEVLKIEDGLCRVLVQYHQL